MANQMVAELKAQDDPRMFGRGSVFEEYPYAEANLRGFYERYMRGEKLQAGSVLPASPVSAKAWQRQPPKSTSLKAQLWHGSGIQPVPR